MPYIARADADLALQELSGDLVACGYFTQSIVLLDRDLKSLKAKQGVLEQAIQGSGFTTLDEIENRNCFDAFLGSIPGNCRPQRASSAAQHFKTWPTCFRCPPCGADSETESNLYNGPALLHTVTGGSTPV